MSVHCAPESREFFLCFCLLSHTPPQAGPANHRHGFKLILPITDVVSRSSYQSQTWFQVQLACHGIRLDLQMKSAATPLH